MSCLHQGDQPPNEDILQTGDDGGNQQEQTNLTDTLRVSGFDSNDEEVALIFFESKQRSGGGRVKAIRRTDEYTFDVTFYDSNGEADRNSSITRIMYINNPPDRSHEIY